jgi:glycosyltransferase involved in cell wall biosynthesis
VLAGTGGRFADEVKALGIPCEVFAFRQLDRWHPAASVRSVASVVRTARRVRAAVIHSNELASFQTAGYAARLLGVPAVSHVRFPDTSLGYRWFLSAGFARALFVSRWLLVDAAAEVPDLFRDRSEVLHDGVEQQAAWSAERSAACRRALGLPLDTVVVALTGQIAEVKGIWEFVEAARMLAARSDRLHFAVLGDDLKTNGELRRVMEARVRDAGLAARFSFLGFRPDAPQIVQAFDIITVPSHVEPLGNATLEAMAAGRPVVGSRVGGIPEMVVDGQTGLLATPKDSSALAEAVWRIAVDDDLRERMSEAARRRSNTHFSIEAHGCALQKIYDRVRHETRSGASRRSSGRAVDSAASL